MKQALLSVSGWIREHRAKLLIPVSYVAIAGTTHVSAWWYAPLIAGLVNAGILVAYLAPPPGSPQLPSPTAPAGPPATLAAPDLVPDGGN